MVRRGKEAVKLDLSNIKIGTRAFCESPMRFVDPEPKQMLSDVIDLIAIETGNRKAREHWQQKQLQNLLQHASARSPFWRKRVGTKRISDLKLSDLPILTRGDVIQQVKSEGSLLRPED